MQIGIDVVKVERIRRLHREFGDKFLKKFFSEDEINYCLARRNVAECLAGRFAAKEAFYKALDHTLQKKIALREIEVLADTTGRPYYRLPSHLGALKTALSITHERDFAIAVCTLIRR